LAGHSCVKPGERVLRLSPKGLGYNYHWSMPLKTVQLTNIEEDLGILVY